MDSVALVRRLAGVLLAAVSGVVFAQASCEPKEVSQYAYSFDWSTQDGSGMDSSGREEGPFNKDQSAACLAAGGLYATKNSYGWSKPADGITVSVSVSGSASFSSGACRFSGTRTGTVTRWGQPVSNSSSQVNVLFTENKKTVTEQCDQCSQTAGRASRAGDMVVKGGSSFPSSVCEGGCQYSVNGGEIASAQRDGVWYHWLHGSQNKGTGTSCQPGTGAGDSPSPEASNIPVGKCPGTVNGVAVVVDCSETKEVKKPTTVESAASSASSPAGAKPGASESSRETTCTGSSCRTTTTTQNHKDDGTTDTKTETTEEPKLDFCAKNASSPLCKPEEESSWGGSCGGFTCGGDAIQCAIAREQHKRNCELFTESEASARGLAAAGAGDKPGDHPGASPTVVPMGEGFDQTNLMPGTCPGDMSVSIAGGSVVLPFSDLCGPAAVLGNLLVGLAALACVAIVFKG